MKILKNSDLAKIMGVSVLTIEGRKSREPETLPPTRLIGNMKVWLESDVIEWLNSLPLASSATSQPKAEKAATRGRPTKAETIARRQAGGAQ